MNSEYGIQILTQCQQFMIDHMDHEDPEHLTLLGNLCGIIAALRAVEDEICQHLWFFCPEEGSEPDPTNRCQKCGIPYGEVFNAGRLG